MSLPIRGARIEKETNHAKQNWMGRSPCGERELKKRFGGYRPDGYGRSPCGERELKYQLTKEKSQWTHCSPRRE